MDTGNKTLAQLSEEGKNARYVTLDVGSKLSGYTKDYLERLCALHKVDFLLWNNDQYAIELESLLRETQTILLSYEGLTFLEKSGLTVPPHVVPHTAVQKVEEESAQNVASPSLAARIPHFVESERVLPRELDGGMFSFTGRAIVSDLRQPEDVARDEKILTPVPVLREGEREQDIPVLSREDTPIISEQKIRAPGDAPLHVPIIPVRDSIIPGDVAAANVSLPEPHELPTHSPVDFIQDEWDHRLLGSSAPGKSETRVPLSLSTSPLPPSPPDHRHPTPADALVSHEDPPLFSKLLDRDMTEVFSLQKKKEIIELQSPVFSAPASPATISTEVAPHFLGPRNSPLPSVRVTPLAPMAEQKNLPLRQPEHHLTLLESHPLMKSVGFNMAFTLLFLIPSFLVLSRTIGTENDQRSLSGSGANLAAVGALYETKTERGKSAVIPFPQEERLLFSDEVVVASGEAPNSVLVQPLFREGAGVVHEYTNARLMEEGTTSESQ